ncbi:BPL-N domain-containing protein [Desulfonatronovibrio magnus]|uniref:BPL-N domain-containing protein n=1 Tax=Desulfonatronovibrio magnus TaxID=698827 RepID=UPI0005EAD3BF|nr:BPL-N domain-containing protein [Desulfonatronovibrio magnus]
MKQQNKTFYMLWDESHLWGVMLARSLKSLRVPFQVIDSKAVKSGLLDANPPAGLLVPGGWARLKALSLSEQGLDNIRTYVRQGGTYIGFCGGAGMALEAAPHAPCLELCPWGRKPFNERLPNFSGHVYCKASPELKLPVQDKDSLMLPVWWPSQFQPSKTSDRVQVLITYSTPGPDFWSSDLNLSQISGQDLSRWESIYGINLNPQLINGEPCLIKGVYGQGQYYLSYSHLETPESNQANTVLYHLLAKTLGNTYSQSCFKPDQIFWDLKNFIPMWNNTVLLKAKKGMDHAIKISQSQFLLFWRTPWLLGWRRGVPGSPINFLYAMICQALSTLPGPDAELYWEQCQQEFSSAMNTFLDQLLDYLSHERLAMALAPSSPECSSNKELQEQKIILFGKFPGYGGLYKKLIKSLDGFIFRQLQEEDRTR